MGPKAAPSPPTEEDTRDLVIRELVEENHRLKAELQDVQHRRRGKAIARMTKAELVETLLQNTTMTERDAEAMDAGAIRVILRDLDVNPKEKTTRRLPKGYKRYRREELIELYEDKIGEFPGGMAKDMIIFKLEQWAVDEDEYELVSEAASSSVDTNRPPNCPNCGCRMVVRTNRVSQEQFYGCPRYPQCKGTYPLNVGGVTVQEYLASQATAAGSPARSRRHGAEGRTSSESMSDGEEEMPDFPINEEEKDMIRRLREARQSQRRWS